MRINVLKNTPQDALTTLAGFVKTARLNQEMTLDELSKRVGVSRSSLTRFEKNGAGSTETQVKIFAALGMLDVFVAALVQPEKPLSIAELRKMNTARQRQRGKRRTLGTP